MALGGAVLQDTRAGQPGLRAGACAVKPPASQGGARSQDRRHVADKNRGRRVRNRGAGVERGAWPGSGGANTLSRDRGQQRAAAEGPGRAESDDELLSCTGGQAVKTRPAKDHSVQERAQRLNIPAWYSQNLQWMSKQVFVRVVVPPPQK